jgi:glycosyltransferase involved in cell wall biosynthesis
MVAVTGWILFAVWVAGLLPSVITIVWNTLRRKTQQLAEPAQWPRLSVIVPSRNEGPNIEAALRSLLETDYPHVEIIAINDRSDDETGEIIDRLASDDERVKVVHITDFPDGWLGKNHAMALGARESSGEWLLFTDGDVLFEPDTFRRSVNYAVTSRIDHLCLMPRMLRGGYWEDALVAFFGLLFALGLFVWLVPTRLRQVYVGVGAFNLVRRSAYEVMGGHEPIRLDVMDDVKLGKLVKLFDFRQHFLRAEEFVQVRWQDSAWGVIRGLEKNAFASMNYSLTMLAATTCLFGLMFISPYVMISLFPDERCLGYAATLLFVHVVYALLGSVFGSGWKVAPVLTFSAVGILFAFWRSAYVTLRQGGIRWRDTFYPLDTLRKNIFR